MSHSSRMSTASDAQAVNVAVFAPFNCTAYDKEWEMLSIDAEKRVQETLDLAEYEVQANWFRLFGAGSFSFHLRMYNVCTDTDAMFTLMEAFADPSITALVGPASHLFCEPAGVLAADYNKALVSWNCVDDAMSIKSSYPTFMRTVPSSGQTARVIAMIFKHFRWKRMAIVYTRNRPYWDLAHTVFKEMEASDFDVTHFVRFSEILDVNSTKLQLAEISSETKGKDFIYILSLSSNSLCLRNVKKQVLAVSTFREGRLTELYHWGQKHSPKSMEKLQSFVGMFSTKQRASKLLRWKINGVKTVLQNVILLVLTEKLNPRYPVPQGAVWCQRRCNPRRLSFSRNLVSDSHLSGNW